MKSEVEKSKLIAQFGKTNLLCYKTAGILSKTDMIKALGEFLAKTLAEAKKVSFSTSACNDGTCIPIEER